MEDLEKGSIIDYKKVDYYCLSTRHDSDDNEDDSKDGSLLTDFYSDEMKIRTAILNIEFAFQSLHIVKLFNPMLALYTSVMF
jgi:hypothetical protein